MERNKKNCTPYFREFLKKFALSFEGRTGSPEKIHPRFKGITGHFEKIHPLFEGLDLPLYPLFCSF